MMISFALVAINGQLPSERHGADDTGLHKSEWAGCSERPVHMSSSCEESVHPGI